MSTMGVLTKSDVSLYAVGVTHSHTVDVSRNNCVRAYTVNLNSNNKCIRSDDIGALALWQNMGWLPSSVHQLYLHRAEILNLHLISRMPSCIKPQNPILIPGTPVYTDCTILCVNCLHQAEGLGREDVLHSIRVCVRPSVNLIKANLRHR